MSHVHIDVCSIQSFACQSRQCFLRGNVHQNHLEDVPKHILLCLVVCLGDFGLQVSGAC